MGPFWNAKLQKRKKKWLHDKIIVTQSWYTSIKIFSVPQFANFSNRSHDWSLLFNFETTQCKNQFDTNLVRIHSVRIEILSFSCFMLFLVTADGNHFGTPNCKKLK